MAVDTMAKSGSVGRLTGIVTLGLLLVLVALPAVAGGLAIDKLTTLFVFILLAAMWNLLAGYAGLASVGQQVFFGLGGYFALRLVDAGIPPYMALLLGACGAATAGNAAVATAEPAISETKTAPATVRRTVLVA